MNDKKHWAYAELKKRLAEQRAQDAEPFRAGEIRITQEYGSIFLFDPAARAKLDEEIRLRYFPSVLKGLQGSSICVHDEENVLRISYIGEAGIHAEFFLGKRFSSGNGVGHHGKRQETSRNFSGREPPRIAIGEPGAFFHAQRKDHRHVWGRCILSDSSSERLR